MSAVERMNRITVQIATRDQTDVYWKLLDRTTYGVAPGTSFLYKFICEKCLHVQMIGGMNVLNTACENCKIESYYVRRHFNYKAKLLKKQGIQ